MTREERVKRLAEYYSVRHGPRLGLAIAERMVLPGEQDQDDQTPAPEVEPVTEVKKAKVKKARLVHEVRLVEEQNVGRILRG